jgi:hypothetical protein
MRTRRTLQAIFWIAVYILLAVAPLLILIPGPRLPRQSFWQLFAVALGFAGLSMMGLQFVLTARFKTIKAPYGSDIVYHFHREISLVAFALVLAHILILITVTSRARALLNFFTAPTHARAAIISVLLLIILIALSIWRKLVRLDYTWWRVSHRIRGAERGHAWTLQIKPVEHAGMRFQPGQLAWLTFGRSPFSETEHPFSFSSNAEHSDSTTFTIKALYEQPNFSLDIVTGVSIGAINAAVFVGAKSDPIRALDELWRERLAIRNWPFAPPSLARYSSLFAHPAMYWLRPSYLSTPLLAPYVETSIYDITALRRTLTDLIGFDRLNHHEMAASPLTFRWRSLVGVAVKAEPQ